MKKEKVLRRAAEYQKRQIQQKVAEALWPILDRMGFQTANDWCNNLTTIRRMLKRELLPPELFVELESDVGGLRYRLPYKGGHVPDSVRDVFSRSPSPIPNEASGAPYRTTLLHPQLDYVYDTGDLLHEAKLRAYGTPPVEVGLSSTAPQRQAVFVSAAVTSLYVTTHLWLTAIVAGSRLHATQGAKFPLTSCQWIQWIPIHGTYFSCLKDYNADLQPARESGRAFTNTKPSRLNLEKRCRSFKKPPLPHTPFLHYSEGMVYGV